MQKDELQGSGLLMGGRRTPVAEAQQVQLVGRLAAKATGASSRSKVQAAEVRLLIEIINSPWILLQGSHRLSDQKGAI